MTNESKTKSEEDDMLSRIAWAEDVWGSTG